MGLFDDFADIVGEIKDLKNEVTREFTDLKSDVQSSVGDIRTGVSDTAREVKSKAKKSISIDGIVGSSQPKQDTTDPSKKL